MLTNLIDTLTKLCADVMEQGSMAPNAKYPARFFTFWNSSTQDHKHYDNAALGVVWTVDVNFYSTNPMDVYSALEAAREALLQAGWVISGKGHAVASDTPTHTGRGFTAVYLET